MKTARLPSSGPEREALREKGQFWTPDWVAWAMVAYVGKRSTRLFDPAVGAGAFLTAARQMEGVMGKRFELAGREIDALALEQARANGLSDEDLRGVELRDFVLQPPVQKLEAIIANPPYIRHHRLEAGVKAQLREFATRTTGLHIDGRAGYHVYFLIRALSLLAPEGRLAFILPADVCEGVFAPALWRWIASQFCLDAVVSFAASATPFPGVDTNALVLMIRNSAPRNEFCWARCLERGSALLEWVLNDLQDPVQPEKIEVFPRSLEEGLRTGLSRPPQKERIGSATLGDFAYVVRGIATGANEFFCFSEKERLQSGIDAQFFVPIVARTRDVSGACLSQLDLESLDASQRPRWMLQLPPQKPDTFPEEVQRYLREGIEAHLPFRPLIKARKWWFCSEKRVPPPFLFAYLGRRHARFIRNRAGVAPLTGFLCVYARDESPENLAKLERVLGDERTLAGLSLVGKSYGSDAIKVEPRALERLPIPVEVLEEAALTLPTVAPTLCLSFD